MFVAIQKGGTQYYPGASLEGSVDLGLLAAKLGAVAASPEYAPVWPAQLDNVVHNQPITTVVELRAAI